MSYTCNHKCICQDPSVRYLLTSGGNYSRDLVRAVCHPVVAAHSDDLGASIHKGKAVADGGNNQFPADKYCKRGGGAAARKLVHAVLVHLHKASVQGLLSNDQVERGEEDVMSAGSSSTDISMSVLCLHKVN